MKRLFVVAIAVTIVASAGRAMATYADQVSICPRAWSGEGEGISDATGNPLALYSATGMAVLNTGVTESNIQTMFNAGNVQGILNSMTVLSTTAIGVGDVDTIDPWDPTVLVGDYTEPGYFLAGNDNVPPYCLSVAESAALEGDQLYMLAVNATVSQTNGLTSATGITQLGIWTIKGTGQAAVNWVMPSLPDWLTGNLLLPDPGVCSSTDAYDADQAAGCTLDAVIGPGEQPCNTGWTSVFNAVWPGQGYTNVGSNGVQLAYVPLPGDANGDGRVDINDLTIVLANYGRTGETWSQGEFTGDGTVDINDLTIVLAHYDQSQGASAAGMAAVPEPAGFLLVAVGAVGLSIGVWRVRGRLRRSGNVRK